MTPGTTPRNRWRVDEGEEARLTPHGPGEAVIESLGSLPFRSRSQSLGVHNRPEFPGTCVVLGGEHFEVVAEQARDTGFGYVLERWRAGLVRRDVVEYGPRLVRAAQREREEAAGREARARYASLSMFLLGLLPEERQVRACERHGVEAESATIAGAALELVVALGLLALLPHVGRLLLAFPIALVVVAPALLRVVGSLAWGDVAGSPLVAFVLGARAALPGRLDTTLVPLTRQAFWARLALPDRLEPLETHDLLVKGLLPHLSWEGSPLSRAGVARATLEVDDEYWQVTPRPAVLEQGRLTYAYELRAPAGRDQRTDLPAPAWPDPRTYQWEVLGDVSRQWDGVFAGFAWLPTLLPREVQERAYRGRGGVAAGRRWTLATIAITAALAAWFASGAGAFNHATALLLFADAVQRSWRAASGDCAPSLLGLALAPLLGAERLAYHAHRDAERAALLALDAERAST